MEQQSVSQSVRKLISEPLAPHAQRPECSLGALSAAQLKSFYSNQELELCLCFVDEFIEAELSRTSDEWFRLLEEFVGGHGKVQVTKKEITDAVSDWEQLYKSVWKQQEEPFRVDGKCGEGRVATGSVSSSTAIFDFASSEKLAAKMDTLRELYCCKVTTEEHLLALAKLRCDSFVSNIVSSCQKSGLIHANVPVQIVFTYNSLLESSRKRICDCLSGCFDFLRRPSLSAEILADIKQWTLCLASCLLRLGSAREHLFLLCHVLRCQEDIFEWAVQFVQPLPIWTPCADSKRYVDHFLTMLRLVLSPVKNREEFLKSYISCESTCAEDWTFVDDDGREDKFTVLKKLSERHQFMLLNKFSFDRLFLLFLQTYCSCLETVSEPSVLTLFAFEHCVSDVLCEGIVRFHDEGYVEVCKQLCYIMRQSLQFVGDYWAECCQQMTAQSYANTCIARLQQEFDRLFCRVIRHIITWKGLGVWQFIVDLPYVRISPHYLCKIVYLLLVRDPLSSEFLSANTENVQQLIDEGVFEAIIEDISENDAVYLVGALSNIVASSIDPVFIDLAVDKLFGVCFVNEKTRVALHKQGRNFVATVCQRHQFLVNVFIKKMALCLSDLQMYGFDVIADLPLSSNQFTKVELDILRSWLLCELASVQNRLARRIVKNSSWASTPFDIAVILVEAYSQHILKTASPDDSFVSFTWNFLTNLHLNRELSYSVSLEQLMLEVEALNPVAFYVVLNTTFDFSTFLVTVGSSLLESLFSKRQSTAAMFCLLRLFLVTSVQDEILQDKRFIQYVTNIIHSEGGWLQFQGIQFPGRNITDVAQKQLNTLAGFVMRQIWTFRVIALDDVDSFVAFLSTLLFMASANWNHDQNVLFLLDALCSFCFLCDPVMLKTRSAYAEQYEHMKDQQSSSIWSWFSLAVSTGPAGLIDVFNFGPFPWLSYVCLLVEEEKFLPILNRIESYAAQNTDESLDSVLKDFDKTCNCCPQSLPVYRWMRLACSFRPDNILLPLVCQKVFVYLLKTNTEQQSKFAHPVSLGARYLNCSVFSESTESLTKLLKLSQECYAKETCSSNDNFASNLHELFTSMHSWIVDKRLYSQHIHPLSLPDFRQRHVLQLILSNSQVPWLDFVSFEKLQLSLIQLLQPHHFSFSAATGSLGQRSPLTRLVDRLRNSISESVQSSADQMKDSNIAAATSTVSLLIDDILLFDSTKAISSARSCFEVVDLTARQHGERAVSLLGLDLAFNEYLPNLHYKFEKQIQVCLTCSPGLLKKCQSPRFVNVSVGAWKLSQSVQHKIDENRRSYQFQLECMRRTASSEFAQASAHILMLASRLKDCHAEAESHVAESGIQLFYYVVSAATPAIMDFPPSEFLISRCLELLGHKFLLRNPAQTEQLLNVILQNRRLQSHLISVFSPLPSNEQFIETYESLCRKFALKQLPADLLLSLLSKYDIVDYFGYADIKLVKRLCASAWNSLLLTNENCHTELYSVLLEHWLCCFSYRFPVLTSFMFIQLLEGCSVKKVSTVVWERLLKLLSALDLNAQISLALLTDVQNFFTVFKQTSSEAVAAGLPCQFSNHTNFIASLTVILLNRIIDSVDFGGSLIDSLRHLKSFWAQIEQFYQPWLQPVRFGTTVFLPWGIDDIVPAKTVVDSFGDIAQKLSEKCDASIPFAYDNALSLCIRYYCDVLCAENDFCVDHVQNVLRHRMLKLSWQNMFPTITIMQLMAEKLSFRCESTRCFLTSVAVKLPWVSVSRHYVIHESKESCSSFHCLLLEIMIKCSLHKQNYQDCKASFPLVLKCLTSCDWSVISTEHLERCLSFLVNDSSSTALLSSEDHVLSSFQEFLKSVYLVPGHCGSPFKAVCYVRAVITSFLNCSNRSETEFHETLSVTLLSLLADVEILSRRLTNVETFTEGPLSEIVNFWNYCTSEVLSEHLAKVLLCWFKQHNPVLLLPFISVALNRLVPAKMMSVILEEVIQCFFEKDSASWDTLLCSIKLPCEDLLSLTKQNAVQNGCVLTLCCVLKKAGYTSLQLSEQIRTFLLLCDTLSSARKQAIPETKLVLIISELSVVLVTLLSSCEEDYSASLINKMKDTFKELLEDSSTFIHIFLGSQSVKFSSRFKLLFVSLNCFLNCHKRTIHSADDKTNKATCVQNLLQLHSQKQFCQFDSTIDEISVYVEDPDINLIHFAEFTGHLICKLFKEFPFLCTASVANCGQ